MSDETRLRKDGGGDRSPCPFGPPRALSMGGALLKTLSLI